MEQQRQQQEQQASAFKGIGDTVKGILNGTDFGSLMERPQSAGDALHPPSRIVQVREHQNTLIIFYKERLKILYSQGIFNFN